MPPRRVVVATALLVSSLGLVAHTMLDDGGWSRRARAAKDLAALRTDNAARAARVDELRARVVALRTRPDVQERVVREELGYVHDGDLVIELP